MPFDKEGCTSGTDKAKRGGVSEGPARPCLRSVSGGCSGGTLTGSWSPSGRGTSRLRFPIAFSSKHSLWGDTLWMAQSGLPLTTSPRRCDLRWPLSAPLGCFSWCLHRFVRHLGRVSSPSFSREERETPGAAPQLCGPAGTDAGPDGARAGVEACVPRMLTWGGLYIQGAVGGRPDPIPRVRSPAGGMRRGVGTGPHPWAPEVSTRSDAHP